MRRLLAAALGAATLLLGTVTPAHADDAYPRTVDEIVAALRDDPILVLPAMGGGDAQDVHDTLTGLADRADVPVHVYLGTLPSDVETGSDASRQLSTLLHRRLGDGVFVVGLPSTALAQESWEVERRIFVAGNKEINALREDEDANRPTDALSTALLLADVATVDVQDDTSGYDDPDVVLADTEVEALTSKPWAFVPEDSLDHDDRSGLRIVLPVAIGLGLLLTLLAAVRVGVAAVPPDRRAVRAARDAKGLPPAREIDVPTTAAREVEALQRRIDRLSAQQLGSEEGVAAERTLEAARLVLARDASLDPLGALVLARMGSRSLQRARKPTRPPYRPCVVDPTHGEATTSTTIAGSTLDVPVCHACSVVEGETLTVRTRLGRRSYLDTDTVWARTGFGALVDDLPGQVLEDVDGR